MFTRCVFLTALFTTLLCGYTKADARCERVIVDSSESVTTLMGDARYYHSWSGRVILVRNLFPDLGEEYSNQGKLDLKLYPAGNWTLSLALLPFYFDEKRGSIILLVGSFSCPVYGGSFGWIWPTNHPDFSESPKKAWVGHGLGRSISDPTKIEPYSIALWEGEDGYWSVELTGPRGSFTHLGGVNGIWLQKPEFIYRFLLEREEPA